MAADSLQEITVEGSRMSREVVGRSATTGAPIEQITLTRHASYANIDLSTHSGAVELQSRVKLTATAACEELDKLFPFTASRSKTHDCITKAVNESAPQVQAAIQSAERARLASQ